MADEAARARAEAIKGFAAVLREVRESAGAPSFREMSGRSSAISHTTLHDAVQGFRLPSWPTVVEFVKACGGDPAQYREEWERADVASRATQPARTRVPEQQLQREPQPEVAPTEGPADDVVDTGPRRVEREVPPWRRRPVLLVGTGVATVALAVGIAVAVGTGGDGPTGTKDGGETAADCPVKQPNPPPQAPRHAGDSETFVADITLPDCTKVGTDRTVVKTWRFKNTGSVRWQGYSLQRVDIPQRSDQCQTITDIPVPITVPGQLVDISTDVTTPRRPGFCFVRFKMVDAAGEVAFPGSRPVNFQIVVG